MAANPVEHVAGPYPQHQPLCGSSLSVRTQTFADAPSGFAPVCTRCQAKLKRLG